MADINIKRGFNIKLLGNAEPEIVQSSFPKKVAVSPGDFCGFRPRLLVSTGDTVKAGTPLCHHKDDERLVLTAPLPGTVNEIVRGERRKIEAIVINTSGKKTSVNFKIPKKGAASFKKDEIIAGLLAGGLFPFFKQRPFGTIADPDRFPRDIFVSLMDTAPLAPPMDIVLDDRKKQFEDGLRILSKLTSGSVYVVINEDDLAFKSWLEKKTYIKLLTCRGPHPAGNVGVHINHVKPLSGRNDIVWTCPVRGVVLIGGLFGSGVVDPEIVVAVTGAAASKRICYRTYMGASLMDFLTLAELNGKNIRFISGNVLTGKQVGPDGFIGLQDYMVTIIPEPLKSRFLGWAMPGFTKLSHSKSFASSWIPVQKSYDEPAALNGGKRAFVATGIYNDVMPMDIYPLFLFKSIITEDIEEMEKLGIYDVIEEDIALCEYVDPSKNELQQLLRRGLDLIEKEG